MNDYDRIATVMRMLDASPAAQPSLEEMADTIGLSVSQFHRLFHTWAGVTPKDFLQCLTVENAKQRLRDSASVLDAALDSGLSGPGRLHDLMVQLEAASPGEFKARGRGTVIEWGVVNSPFGSCSIGWNTRGICHLAFHPSAEIIEVPDGLLQHWPDASFLRNEPAAAEIGLTVFGGEKMIQSGKVALKVFVRGTPFQTLVWRALLAIPEGSVSSYGKIAGLVGKAKACRAVGTACGNNPIAWLIPCHRVIRETGVIQGYRWGHERKRAMLGYEWSRVGMGGGQC